MMRTQSKTVALAALALALMIRSADAVDVRVESDKTFDFKSARTWAWNPRAPGEVMMARTLEDDPDAMKQKAEPWILDAVATGMTRLKLTPATSAPDLTVTYYLLLSTNMSSQTVGQFIPAVPEWGLPPFMAATQSLKVMNRGSLVLDLSANGRVVWRGLAETNIRLDSDDQKRESAVREGVRDLLRRYPIKP